MAQHHWINTSNPVPVVSIIRHPFHFNIKQKTELIYKATHFKGHHARPITFSFHPSEVLKCHLVTHMNLNCLSIAHQALRVKIKPIGYLEDTMRTRTTRVPVRQIIHPHKYKSFQVRLHHTAILQRWIKSIDYQVVRSPQEITDRQILLPRVLQCLLQLLKLWRKIQNINGRFREHFPKLEWSP